MKGGNEEEWEFFGGDVVGAERKTQNAPNLIHTCSNTIAIFFTCPKAVANYLGLRN